jgi:hypothetical protein
LAPCKPEFQGNLIQGKELDCGAVQQIRDPGEGAAINEQENCDARVKGEIQRRVGVKDYHKNEM